MDDDEAAADAAQRSAGRGRIVVGVDGSESSCEALRFAVRQADLSGAELHAVTAWEVPFAFDASGIEAVEWVELADARLEGALEETLPAGVRARVRRHVVEGHPAAVLLRAARGADLLVVGSRGHGGFVGLLLGSVGQHRVTHASCPTVVVHLDDLSERDDSGLADAVVASAH